MHWYYRVTGVDTVTLHFGDEIDIALVDPIRRAAEALKQQLQQRVVDLVPSYTTLLVRYDLLQDDLASLIRDIGTVLAQLPQSDSTTTAGTVVEIPVFYHSSVGPDLETIASRAGLSVAEVIERHSARLYNVYAIGFAPGFAYLGEVPAELATPRLDTPRARVPAGTLGIADTQTAIYPLESPGGWNLIGRTPVRLFDPEKEPPSLLSAGQQVRFRPISRNEYLQLGGRLDDLPEPAAATELQGEER